MSNIDWFEFYHMTPSQIFRWVLLFLNIVVIMFLFAEELVGAAFIVGGSSITLYLSVFLLYPWLRDKLSPPKT